jgi:hypothetical protein
MAAPVGTSGSSQIASSTSMVAALSMAMPKTVGRCSQEGVVSAHSLAWCKAFALKGLGFGMGLSQLLPVMVAYKSAGLRPDARSGSF